MSEELSYSSRDLFLLFLGLKTLEKAPDKHTSGESYWFDNGKIRSSKWNWDWFSSPQAAWERVPYRGWLIANFLVNITGQRQDFTAISEPLIVSFDLLPSEIRPEMRTASQTIKEAVESDSGYLRSFLTTLSVGLSKRTSGGKEVIVFGAGMRRRTRVWLKGVNESQAVQAEVEFFVPFYVVPSEGDTTGGQFPDARSICAGIALTRVNGSSIGVDKSGTDLSGVRFNFRIPFTGHFWYKHGTLQSELKTIFDNPKVEAQKRGISPLDKDAPLAWEASTDWKTIVEAFTESNDGKELLAAPLGPLLLEEASDSSIKDIYQIKQVKKDLKDAKAELKEARALLKGLLKKKPPKDTANDPEKEKDDPAAIISERNLGEFLETLGLLTSKGKVEDLSSLTVWDVFTRLVDELDGFPLYVLSAKPTDDNGVRAALTLASQADLSDARKHYFGLAGLAYDIPLKTAPKKDKYLEETQYLFFEGDGEEDDDLLGSDRDSPLLIGDDYGSLDDDDEFDGGSPLLLDDDEYDNDDDTDSDEASSLAVSGSFSAGPTLRHGNNDDPPLISDDESDDGNDNENDLDNVTGKDSDEEQNTPPTSGKKKAEKKSVLEVKLHLGKWLSGETLDDNWFRRLLPPGQALDKSFWKRRAPLPGIRLLPLQKTSATDGDKKTANYGLTLRGDLLSLGVDLTGNTKDGLTFLKKGAGPVAYFGLGAIETRIALLLSNGRVAFGIGIKLKDLRLSFAPKSEDKVEDDKSKDDLIGPLQDILSDWVEVPISEKAKEKAKPKTVKTRLGGKQKDKFSISIGYLSPLTENSHGTLDLQLYNQKGDRSELVWIPIDRRKGPLYLKNIGITLKGIENVELAKGLSDEAQFTVALTGGLRYSNFELGLIGAKLTIPFKNPASFQVGLDGLDLSVKLGAVIISGSFLQTDDEFAGSVTIDLPKFSIGAMGAYGKLLILSQTYDADIAAALEKRDVPEKLRVALAQKGIYPADSKPITGNALLGQWTLRVKSGGYHTLIRRDGKLKVFAPDSTLFIYGSLSAAGGAGLTLGPIQFTGIALGFGVNRRVKVPPVEKVAEFPLVKMVMGEGGYQEDEFDSLQEQLGKPVEDPLKVLEKMQKSLPVEAGQYFICGGVRFTIAQTADCFGLIIVQFGNEFEFSLLGLARIRLPRDLTAKPLCYLELQILLSVKPSEGCFKLQAALSNNSWVISPKCKLTGGFALYAWFNGKHKNDFVITLGGYHPRFRRPDHYPIVPRVGLNWQISDNLRIKGEAYLAITPSCLMVGERLEAAFYASRVSVWFTAYLDTLLSWSPLHYEIDLGVTLRAEVDLFLFTLRLTISAVVQMWGPPDGGLIHLELSVLTLDIPFGTPREQSKPELIKSWAQFCQSFLPAAQPAGKPTGAATVIAGSTVQPNLAAGRANAAQPERQQAPASFSALRAPSAEQPDQQPEVWKVRGDQLKLAAAAAVPVTSLNFGRVKTNSPPQGVQDRSLTGQSLLAPTPVELESAGLQTRKYAAPLGIHPMGARLESVLNVTIVRDDVSPPQPVDLTGWTLEEETGSLPAALWDAAIPNPKGPTEPSAKIIPDCITGIKSLTPPIGGRGEQASLTEMRRSSLEPARVPKSDGVQEIAAAARARNLGPAIAAKRAEQKRVFDALTAVGFRLAWQPAQTNVRFRELQAEPLSGAVAAFIQ